MNIHFNRTWLNSVLLQPTMFNLLFKCSSSSQILSCVHFGGACDSKLHFLTKETENLCITFNSISNVQVLAKYLKDTTPWRTEELSGPTTQWEAVQVLVATSNTQSVRSAAMATIEKRSWLRCWSPWIEIDDRLEQLDYNFERIHSKTLSLMNGWRARQLPIL